MANSNNVHEIMGNLDRAYNSFTKMQEIIRTQKKQMCKIVGKDDDDFADMILGYSDRVAEILMDLQELKIPQLKGE